MLAIKSLYTIMPTKILATLFLFITTATLTRPRPASLAVCNKPFFQTDGAQDISHAHGAPYVCIGTWGMYTYTIYFCRYTSLRFFPSCLSPSASARAHRLKRHASCMESLLNKVLLPLPRGWLSSPALSKYSVPKSQRPCFYSLRPFDGVCFYARRFA